MNGYKDPIGQCCLKSQGATRIIIMYLYQHKPKLSHYSYYLFCHGIHRYSTRNNTKLTKCFVTLFEKSFAHTMFWVSIYLLISAAIQRIDDCIFIKLSLVMMLQCTIFTISHFFCINLEGYPTLDLMGDRAPHPRFDDKRLIIINKILGGGRLPPMVIIFFRGSS